MTDHMREPIYDGTEHVCATCPVNIYGERVAWDQAHPHAAHPIIPSDAVYITWLDPGDNGEDRIAMRYGHPANRVWRIGFDTLNEEELVRDFIGNALVTVLVPKEA